MRLSTSSAYVEAVLGGPQNHPARNMEEPQVPGPSSEPAIYNMIPHMFLWSSAYEYVKSENTTQLAQYDSIDEFSDVIQLWYLENATILKCFF